MTLIAFSGRLLPLLSIRTYHSQKENGSVLAHLPYSSYLSDLPLPQSLSVAEDVALSFSPLEHPAQADFSAM